MRKTLNKEKLGPSFLKTRRGKRMIFYALICALPVLQFCIFTLYINFNSIVMAFQTWAIKDGKLQVVAWNFDNFKVAWNVFTSKSYLTVNSLGLFASNLFITIPLALIFSFYLCKECRFSGAFRVVLYMPNIISPMIFGLLFQRICNNVYPQIIYQMTGEIGLPLLTTSNGMDAYGLVLFFNIWVSFGVNVLMFTGAMSGINVSIVESAQLDGANIVHEFMYITVPMIFSTVSTFIILGMAGIFTNQMHLYTFFGWESSGLETMGYYIYVNAQRSDYVDLHNGLLPSLLSYPQLAALGILLTLIIAPITFIARKLFDKYGPSEN